MSVMMSVSLRRNVSLVIGCLLSLPAGRGNINIAGATVPVRSSSSLALGIPKTVWVANMRMETAQGRLHTTAPETTYPELSTAF